MAIIVCPECGEKISNTAKICIHCGCKINACPECETVTAGDAEHCPTCGYEFVKTPPTQNSGQNLDKIETVVDAFRQSTPFAKYLSSPLIYLILLLLSFAFIFIGATKFLIWMRSDDFILTYKETLNSVKNLFIFATIFIIIIKLYSIYSVQIYKELYSRFLSKNKIDLLPLLQKALGIDLQPLSLEKRFQCALNIRDAVAIKAQKTNALYKNTEQTICAFLFSVAVIFLAIFIIGNVEACMDTTAILGKKHFKFSMIEHWGLLIFSVVLFITNKILEKYFKKAQEKTLDSWVEKNLPEYANVYKHEIKKIETYINAYNKRL